MERTHSSSQTAFKTRLQECWLAFAAVGFRGLFKWLQRANGDVGVCGGERHMKILGQHGNVEIGVF